MKRSRRYDPDPEVDAYLRCWDQAGSTVLLALALSLAWGVCAYIGGSLPHQEFAAIPRLFASVFKYGAAVAAVIAICRYVYAYVYPPWRDL